MKASLTVFFEEPFWVGVFERIEDGKLSACKVTFGAEPKDYEVWDYILHHYYELVFSPAIEIQTRQAADNPKRRSRNARKHLENTGIGTKSQQALQRQREEMKNALQIIASIPAFMLKNAPTLLAISVILSYSVFIFVTTSRISFPVSQGVKV